MATSKAVEGLFAEDAVEITTSDTTVYPEPIGVSVGTGGDVRVVTARGTTVTFRNRPSGSELPVRVRQVLATGTTASNFVALY